MCYIPEVSIKTEKISLHFYDLCGKAVSFYPVSQENKRKTKLKRHKKRKK
jgi:hypothetical protein